MSSYLRCHSLSLYLRIGCRYNHKVANGAKVELNGGLELREGDGSFANADKGEVIQIENTGDRDAEVLVFDLE